MSPGLCCADSLSPFGPVAGIGFDTFSWERLRAALSEALRRWRAERALSAALAQISDQELREIGYSRTAAGFLYRTAERRGAGRD